jgi:aminomethyltransferase
MLDAKAGTIRYALVLDHNGLMLDEGTNFVVGPDDVFFMGNDDLEAFAAHVSRLTADLDVEVENATDRMPNVAVQGPRSFELLSGLTSTDLSSLGYFRLIPEPVEIAGIRCFVTRTGFTGELGYELYLLDGPAQAEALWNAIADAGARPFGLDAIQKLRMEMGLVIQEEDYFPAETDPRDMSLEGFIDLDGHDFIGREPFATRAVGEPPPRRFKTLEVAGTDLPEHGTRVTNDTGDVGVVTSAANSPRFGVLALAVLESAAAVNGAPVRVANASATIRPLPLDTEGRPRMRPSPAKG